MNDFFKQIATEGIPVDVNVDIPDRTLIILGLVLFLAILVSQILATLITWGIMR